VIYGAGEGMDPDLPIDPTRLPEEPVPPGAPPAETAGPPPTDLLPEVAEPVTPPVSPRPKPAPAEAAPPPAVATGTVQLGAFSSEARARGVWKEMQGRFAYLKGWEPTILPVARNGTTLYRLRATGPDAAETCTRLRIAGEDCEPVR
jgi:cell division septation protein DedD